MDNCLREETCLLSVEELLFRGVEEAIHLRSFSESPVHVQS